MGLAGGSFLPAGEILKIIDQSGNRDGFATTGDIVPHLDTGQKIALDTSNRFHQALATLNRICHQPLDTFHMPSVLRCSVIQKSKLEIGRVAQKQNAFVRAQFDKAFHNEHSDALIRNRYKEFLTFVEKNRVPLSDLYGVLVNMDDFSVPIEEVLSQNLFFIKNQMEALFQLSLTAAMWHLKHNVKAFASEELRKYPEWFQKKVKGFEDTVLEKLKNWQLSSELGRKRLTVGAAYDPSTKKIITPDSNPFPSILQDEISDVWHEAFHAYRATQVAAESLWAGERDATLVGYIALLKMKKIDDPADERLKKITKKDLLRELSPQEAADKIAWKIAFESRIAEYKYAVYFSRNQEDTALRSAFERKRVDHVFRVVFESAYATFDFSSVRDDQKKYSLHMKARSKAEQKLRTIQDGTYEWTDQNGNKSFIRFSELLRQLNDLLERHFGTLDEATLSKVAPHSDIINDYILHLMAKEIFERTTQKFEKGQANWNKIDLYEDLLQSLKFIQQYKWVLIRANKAL